MVVIKQFWQQLNIVTVPYALVIKVAHIPGRTHPLMSMRWPITPQSYIIVTVKSIFGEGYWQTSLSEKLTREP